MNRLKYFSLLMFIAFFTLAAGLFAGGGSQSGSARTPAGGRTDGYGEHMDISIAIWGIGSNMAKGNAKDDVIFNDILKRFNITIVPVNITWTDFHEKIRLWAATGQLPDIFCEYPSIAQYKQWAEEGVLKALPKDLSGWREIQSALSDPTVAAYNVNGTFYMIPGRDYKDVNDPAINCNVLYRTDWARQAGWNRPLTSLDDYINLVKTVKAQHPGVSGLTLRNPTEITNLMLGLYPYGALELDFYVKENDLWKPVYATEGFAQAMAGLRRLWTEGVLDRDAAINTNEEGELKFFSGLSFSYATNNIGRFNRDLWVAATGGMPAEEGLDFMELWPAPDGNRYHAVGFPGGHKTMISSGVNDRKLGRIMDLLEYMNQEDTLITLHNGRENIDWKWENGQMISLLKPGESKYDKYPVACSDFRALGAWGSWLFLTGKSISDPDPDHIYTGRRFGEWYQYIIANHKAPVINWAVQNITTPGKEKAGTFAVTNDMWPVIMGTGDPVAMWKTVIRDYERRGLTEAINEMTAEAKKLGL
jgi:putative aldouronate transport system substrate-binding protein